MISSRFIPRNVTIQFNDGEEVIFPNFKIAADHERYNEAEFMTISGLIISDSVVLPKSVEELVVCSCVFKGLPSFPETLRNLTVIESDLGDLVPTVPGELTIM